MELEGAVQAELTITLKVTGLAKTKDESEGYLQVCYGQVGNSTNSFYDLYSVLPGKFEGFLLKIKNRK